MSKLLLVGQYDPAARLKHHHQKYQQQKGGPPLVPPVKCIV
jgi:hypothetical protein